MRIALSSGGGSVRIEAVRLAAASRLNPVAAAKRVTAQPAGSASSASPQKQAVDVSISAAGATLSKSAVAASGTSLSAKSGNTNLDAVLAGGNYWWRASNGTATLSSTKITPTVYQIESAQALHALTYSWLTGTESYLTSTDTNQFSALDTGQKTAVKSALDYLSTLINVTFTEETSSPASASIRFGTNDQGTTSAGYATYPNGNGSNPSKLLLGNSGTSGTLNSSANLGTKGSYGWETLIHEMGHIMGLKHPGNYNAGGGGTAKPYLPTSYDNRRMSIMSYNNPSASSSISVTGSQSANGGYSYSYSLSAINPSTYGVFDAAAMQYLYGANTSTTAADLSVTDNFADYQTLWAPQGIKVDASATTKSNVFDLRESAYSSIAVKTTTDYQTSISTTLKANGFSDANALTVSKSIVKKAGSKLYNGKNNLALAFGSKYSTVNGGSAADTFYASTYSATVDGNGGTDKLYLTGKASDWTINKAAGTATNKTSQAVITYKNIETIAYYSATSSVLHA